MRGCHGAVPHEDRERLHNTAKSTSPHHRNEWQGREQGNRQQCDGRVPHVRARGQGRKSRHSRGIPRAGLGSAELGARRCGSWLLSSSRTSRSSWSVESRSATTHYFQWAVSCGRAGPCLGAALGRDRAPVPGNCSIPALLLRTWGGGHGQMEAAEGRGEKKEMERQRQRRRERCSERGSAVPSTPALYKSQTQPELQG